MHQSHFMLFLPNFGPFSGIFGGFLGDFMRNRNDPFFLLCRFSGCFSKQKHIAKRSDAFRKCFPRQWLESRLLRSPRPLSDRSPLRVRPWVASIKGRKIQAAASDCLSGQSAPVPLCTTILDTYLPPCAAASLATARLGLSHAFLSQIITGNHDA